MMFLRDIKKLTIKKSVSGIFTKWRIQRESHDSSVPILFGDGFISINSQAKLNIANYQAENYATLVTDGFDIVEKHSLQDGDILLGRIDNYLLFKGGNLTLRTKNLDLSSKDFNITCDKLTINGIVFSFTGGKLLLNNKEVAVVGGDINPSTNKIQVSGQ